MAESKNTRKSNPKVHRKVQVTPLPLVKVVEEAPPVPNRSAHHLPKPREEEIVSVENIKYLPIPESFILHPHIEEEQHLQFFSESN
ncbi:hypothetical protein M8J76_003462 [Diaphorina citri]|nr:hypothetical protein M8J76_003462 [Diaphorina citri]